MNACRRQISWRDKQADKIALMSDLKAKGRRLTSIGVKQILSSGTQGGQGGSSSCIRLYYSTSARH